MYVGHVLVLFMAFGSHSFVCPLGGFGSCSSTGSLCELDQVNFLFFVVFLYLLVVCMAVVLIVIVVTMMLVVNF
jgi:hypothetical protein